MLKDWEPTENDVWKRKTQKENSKDPTEKILAKGLKICLIEGKKRWEDKTQRPILFEEVTSAKALIFRNKEKCGF